jgi:rod shape-determining protein MreC
MPFRRKFRVRNPSEGRKREHHVSAYVIAVIAVLLVISFGFALAGRKNPLKEPMLWATSGAASALRAIADGFLSFGYIFKLKPIHDENIQLANDNALLKKEVSDLEAYKAECERLRKLMKIPEIDSYDFVSARIIGRNLDLWFESVNINRGSKSGVEVGDLAINADGLVGEIEEVGAMTAKVRLLLNPDFAIGAITSVSRQQGVVVGSTREDLELSNSLEMGFVPKKNRIALGEKVFTSGLASGRPSGVYIGMVTKIVEEPNRITQTIEVTPAVDLGSLEEVTVILSKKPQEVSTR